MILKCFFCSSVPPKGYEGDKYKLNIKVNDKPLGGDSSGRYCWGSCNFYVRNFDAFAREGRERLAYDGGRNSL